MHDETIGGFLEAVAARQPAPSGGAVTAVTAAGAAALVAMAARFSDGHEEAAARMDTLRARALELAEEDARAYGRVLEARRLPRDTADRDERLQAALVAATEVPLAMARTAGEIAAAAARMVVDGNRNLRGDAAAGGVLAAASARSAAQLVRLNAAMRDLPGDPLGEAERCRDEADEAARTAEAQAASGLRG